MKIFLEGAELPGGLPTNLGSCVQLRFLGYLLPGAQEDEKDDPTLNARSSRTPEATVDFRTSMESS